MKKLLFKKLERKRPNFLDEMLTSIEIASEKAPAKLIRRIKDLARLDLDDQELQEAFYHMLKGSISRKDLLENKELSLKMKDRAYVSLFNFINHDGKGDGIPTIEIQHAPREILKAIFASDETVEAIILRRQELAKSNDNGAESAFKQEFVGKRRVGLDENLLNFKLTLKKKNLLDYN